MIKKTISSALVFVIIAALLSGCSFFNKKQAELPEAAAPETEPVKVYDSPTFVLDKLEAHAGDTVTMGCHIMQSPGIAAARVVLEFDNDSLVLNEIRYGPDFAEGGDIPGNLESPTVLCWNRLENFEGDALFAELEFSVKDSVRIFSVLPVNIIYTADDVINIDEEEVFCTVENGSITIAK